MFFEKVAQVDFFGTIRHVQQERKTIIIGRAQENILLVGTSIKNVVGFAFHQRCLSQHPPMLPQNIKDRPLCLGKLPCSHNGSEPFIERLRDCDFEEISSVDKPYFACLAKYHVAT